MSTQDVFSVAMAGKAMDVSQMSGQLIQRTQEEVAERTPPEAPSAQPRTPSMTATDNHVDVYT